MATLPPPDTRYEPGPTTPVTTRVRAAVWSPDGTVSQVDTIDDVVAALSGSECRVWIDLQDATSEVLGRLVGPLRLHPLVVEDILERDQRPKVESYGDDLMHLVVFAPVAGSHAHLVEMDIALGRTFLLTAHPAGWEPFEVGSVARLGAGHFLAKGPDAALYATLDAIVDAYFPMIDRLSDVIEDLEDAVMDRPDRSIVERLFEVRRDLLGIRRAITPEREVLNQLTNRENELVAPATLVYFRDVYDHLVRITDELDSFREVLSGALEAYLSVVNNGLSDVMKRLTAVTAVLAGVGAIAGLFGMSEAATAFDLREGSGFWVVTGIVILVGALTLAWFRRIDWI